MPHPIPTANAPRGETVSSAGRSILEDPRGRRKRIVAVAGAIATALFVCWLVAITLGGVGLSPLPNLPVPGLSKSDEGPAPLTRDQAEMRVADPAPPAALPATVTPVHAAAGSGRKVLNRKAATKRQSASVIANERVRTPNAPATEQPGNSGDTPAATRRQPTTESTTTTTDTTAPGRSDTAPGQTGTTPGRSDTAPGRTTDPGRGPELRP